MPTSRLTVRRRGSWLAITALAALAFTSITAAAVPVSNAASGGASPGSWTMFGQNVNNTASAGSMQVGTNNVKALKPKWAFTTGGDVSARAAIANGVAYFPDWSGHLYAIKSS